MIQGVSGDIFNSMRKKETKKNLFILVFDLEVNRNTICVGLARVGASDQNIVACTLEEMVSIELGRPLHCMVVAAPSLHPLEEEYLEQFFKSERNK